MTFPNFTLRYVIYLFNEMFLWYMFLAHLAFRPCELLSSPFVRRLSINISHFNLLLRNHQANCNQTLVEWSLVDPLPKLCPVIQTSNQDGHQAKNSYMARSSFTYIPGFSVKFFFQPIYTDYANQAYFDKRSHLNLLL